MVDFELEINERSDDVVDEKETKRGNDIIYATYRSATPTFRWRGYCGW